jgi:hypothetical protein
MLSHLRRNAVAYVALFVALGGTSYAAVQLPKESVGTSTIKPHAVTGYRIAPNAITSAKVKDHSLYAKDFAGSLPAGPRGRTGPTGADGHDGIDGKNGVNGKDGTNGHDGTNGTDGQRGPAGPTDAAFADDSDPENGNGPTTPTHPSTTTFKQVTLTTGAAGGKVAVTEARATAGVVVCPADSPARCNFEVGVYVDGIGVPGTMTTLSAGAGGTTFAAGAANGGLLSGVAAGSHTVVLGLAQTTGSPATVTFPDGRLLAIAIG